MLSGSKGDVHHTPLGNKGGFLPLVWTSELQILEMNTNMMVTQSKKQKFFHLRLQSLNETEIFNILFKLNKTLRLFY